MCGVEDDIMTVLCCVAMTSGYTEGEVENKVLIPKVSKVKSIRNHKEEKGQKLNSTRFRL